MISVGECLAVDVRVSETDFQGPGDFVFKESLSSAITQVDAISAFT
jgi:hypothetical protein